jgi:hypothetical protein
MAILSAIMTGVIAYFFGLPILAGAHPNWRTKCSSQALLSDLFWWS